MLGLLLSTLPGAAHAASISSATFSGGTGTFTNGSGAFFAKPGVEVTLSVVADNNNRCVHVTGPGVDQKKTASPYTFTFPAPPTVGQHIFQILVANNYNAPQDRCAGGEQQASRSLTVDKDGPAVTGTKSPAANAAGWSNGDVTVDWRAIDDYSGVKSGSLAPTSQSIAEETAGTTLTATAEDNVGNLGTGSIEVKLDKTAPTVTPSQAPAANAAGWNNTDVTVSFACSDGLSGVKSCPSPVTRTNSGAVSGTAVDNADNAASASREVKIDKVSPTLSGTPTTPPNGANGWYTSNVGIAWSASDDNSGVAAPPSNSTISGEGTGLTATETVSDRAGNSTTATSSPAVRIDRTAPVTSISAPEGWNGSVATVELAGDDNLSGVDRTLYKVDGAAAVVYSGAFTLDEGDHSVEYWSVDEAGNVEAANTAKVQVDRTAPGIAHKLDPEPNNGWNNSDVTVTFTCTDNLSGIQSCGPAATVSSEGRDQQVTGTAVDNAGNTAEDTATVNVDKTAPTISAAADRRPNHHGWYRDDVTVTFTCDDALSGVGAAQGGTDCPDPQVLGQGADQSASGSVTDAAGNTATAGVTGINVDKIAPQLSGTPSDTGWVNHDVTVTWECSDALSGIDGDCPADSTVTGEGGNLSTSATVHDRAGNSSTGTVDGIQIDRTAPVTTATVPEVPSSGWFRGPVAVELVAIDALSGAARTYYTVDAGARQEYHGAFEVSGAGSHTVRFWSVDDAGNVEDKDGAANQLVVRVDDIAPVITGDRTPANGHGWNNGAVDVWFACGDEHSGMADNACGPAATLEEEGEGQSVTGTARDVAGNQATATVDNVNIDLTRPTLSGNATTAPNDNGWYNGDVTVQWTGEDDLSGIDPATQPADTLVTGEGGNLVAGPVTIADKAGNLTEATVNGIAIDRTKPVITDAGATTAPDGADGWYVSAVTTTFTATDNLSGVVGPGSLTKSSGTAEGSAVRMASGSVSDRADNVAASIDSAPFKIDLSDPTDVDFQGGPAADTTYTTATVPAEPTCTALDAVSGLDSCVVSGYSTAVGTHTMTATATDKAGRTSKVQRTYTVKPAYATRGFFAPVDSGSVLNSVKGGSTVPLKFEVFEEGVELTSTSVVKEIRQAEVACDGGLSTDEIEATATGGTSLRYDATAGQFVYNWQTPKTAGKCYRATVTLADGHTKISALFKTR